MTDPFAPPADARRKRNQLRWIAAGYWLMLAPTLLLCLITVFVRVGTFWLLGPDGAPPRWLPAQLWFILATISAPVPAAMIVWRCWKSLRSQFE